MTTAKEQLLTAIDQAPESLIQEVLDFLLFLQTRQGSGASCAGVAFPEASHSIHNEPSGQSRTSEKAAEIFQKIMEISEQTAQLPVLDNRTPDEILGYNAYGLPE